MRIKQSICYPTVANKIAIDPLCQAAAEIGFAGIGIWGPGPDFEDLVAAIKRHKLRVATIVGHTSLQDGLNKRCQPRPHRGRAEDLHRHSPPSTASPG